jgi:ribonuclease HI
MIVHRGSFGAGAAPVIVSPSKVRTSYATKMQFQYTNNIAEYEAMLLGLRKLKAMSVRRAVLKSDSQVIIGQVDKSSKVESPGMEKYFDIVRRMESSFERFSVKSILRLDNEHANMSAKSVAQGLALPLKCSSKC